VSGEKRVVRSPTRRRPYSAPTVRLVALDVMASFPQNCKMDVGVGGFGGAAGPCMESTAPRVWCLQNGS
jgi:hypothetical protein